MSPSVRHRYKITIHNMSKLIKFHIKKTPLFEVRVKKALRPDAILTQQT